MFDAAAVSLIRKPPSLSADFIIYLVGTGFQYQNLPIPGDGSLPLLNESFATTAEKEASVLAWDITRALTEAHVIILTSFGLDLCEELAEKQIRTANA